MLADFVASNVKSDDIFVGNCLSSLFAKCGSLENATEVFDDLSTKNVVTWNSMVRICTAWAGARSPLSVRKYATGWLVTADCVTFMGLPKASGWIKSLRVGRNFMQRYRKLILKTMWLLGVAWLTCMGSVEAQMMLAKCNSICGSKRPLHSTSGMGTPELIP